jgi:hypothetical protein
MFEGKFTVHSAEGIQDLHFNVHIRPEVVPGEGGLCEGSFEPCEKAFVVTEEALMDCWGWDVMEERQVIKQPEDG